jgi:hypothetical protein
MRGPLGAICRPGRESGSDKFWPNTPIVLARAVGCEMETSTTRLVARFNQLPLDPIASPTSGHSTNCGGGHPIPAFRGTGRIFSWLLPMSLDAAPLQHSCPLVS